MHCRSWAASNCCELLRTLYGRVEIPAEVHREVVERGLERGAADAVAVQMAVSIGFLRVNAVDASQLPADLAALPLDAGEKQVLLLAMRHAASLVLLDDLKAREEAQRRGLATKGTLGVLVEATRAGHLTRDETELLIDAAIARPDIWIAEGLCRYVLDALRAEIAGA